MQQTGHHPVCLSVHHRHHYPWKKDPQRSKSPGAFHYDHAGLGLLGSPRLCTSHHLVRPWGSSAAETARKKALYLGRFLGRDGLIKRFCSVHFQSFMSWGFPWLVAILEHNDELSWLDISSSWSVLEAIFDIP